MLQCFKKNHFLQEAPPIKKLGLWLCLLCFTTVTVVDGYAKLPNGDGTTAVTGSTETLRHVVYKWLNSNTRQQVVNLYGPIEDWDTSDITNMNYVFWGADGAGASTFKHDFNADISKWDMSAVTSMTNSKYSNKLKTLCLFNSRFPFPFPFYGIAFCVAFTHAMAFTCDLSSWDTSKVITMNASKYTALFNYYFLVPEKCI